MFNNQDALMCLFKTPKFKLYGWYTEKFHTSVSRHTAVLGKSEGNLKLTS